jgi:hypothetical protein
MEDRRVSPSTGWVGRNSTLFSGVRAILPRVRPACIGEQRNFVRTSTIGGTLFNLRSSNDVLILARDGGGLIKIDWKTT